MGRRPRSKLVAALGATASLAVASTFLAAVATASARTQLAPVSQPQWCANRWNQMRMTGFPTLASVGADRRCGIVLAYSVRGRCAKASAAPGGRGWCVDKSSGFACALDRFGAYECATHASPIHVSAWNAALTAGGRIAPDHPQAGVSTPLPSWATRYPFADGYVHPWRTTGGLRRGLSLNGSQHATCSATSERTRTPGALRCFASANDLQYDPCFAEPSRPTVVACSLRAGDTSFVRVVRR